MQKTTLWPIFFVFSLMMNSFSAQAQAVYEIDSVQDHIRLSKFAYYLEDQNGILSFEDVLKTEDQFRPLRTNGNLNSESTFWGRVQIKNNLKSDKEWIFFPGTNNHITLYIPEDNDVYSVKAGRFDPASEKTGAGMSSFGVPVLFKAGETKTLYIRLKNVNHVPVSFNIHLIDPPTWMKYINRESRNLIQGIFQGVLWIMILYNIFLFFINKDKTYLYYSLYMLGLSIYFLNIQGFFAETFLKEVPVLTWHISVAVNIASIFYVQFIRRFLNLEKLLPRWDDISRYVIWGFIFLVVFKLVILQTSFNIPLLNLVMQTALLIGSIFSLVLVIYLFRTGDRVGRFFIAGTFFLVVSMLVSSLSYYNQGGFTLDYFNYLQAGVIAEIILFSLGLGYRMRINEEEKRLAQDELILQLKKNERIQKQATTLLERKVLERTAEIMEKNNKLEQLNEEKNHLMSIVAHDLRNPLGSAMSISSLMEDEKDTFDEDHQEYIELLTRTLNRMNLMIEKILDYRKVEMGELNMSLEPINPTSVIRQITSGFKGKCKSRDITLKVQANDDLSMQADRSFFIQILENLISNALKFSPEGTNITVRAFQTGDRIRISVADQGQGITEEDQKKIFGKFQRLSAKPMHGETSIGLGLSIVKKFTEAMNGRVWAESQPGEGAEFILEFYAIKEDVAVK